MDCYKVTLIVFFGLNSNNNLLKINPSMKFVRNPFNLEFYGNQNVQMNDC